MFRFAMALSLFFIFVRKNDIKVNWGVLPLYPLCSEHTRQSWGWLFWWCGVVEERWGRCWWRCFFWSREQWSPAVSHRLLFSKFSKIFSMKTLTFRFALAALFSFSTLFFCALYCVVRTYAESLWCCCPASVAIMVNRILFWTITEWKCHHQKHMSGQQSPIWSKTSLGSHYDFARTARSLAPSLVG